MHLKLIKKNFDFTVLVTKYTMNDFTSLLLLRVCFFGAHQMRVGYSVWVHKGKLQTGYKLETKVMWTKCCSILGQTVSWVKRQSPCNS